MCVCVCGCMWLNVCHHSNTLGEDSKGQPGLGVWLTTPGNQSAPEFFRSSQLCPYQWCRISVWLARCGLGVRIAVKKKNDLEGVAKFKMNTSEIKLLPRVLPQTERTLYPVLTKAQLSESQSDTRCTAGPDSWAVSNISIKVPARSSSPYLSHNMEITQTRVF